MKSNRELFATCGGLRNAARLLGYASHASLTRQEAGLSKLRPDQAAWLRRYARFRAHQQSEEAEWLAQHPAPKPMAKPRRAEPEQEEPAEQPTT